MYQQEIQHQCCAGITAADAARLSDVLNGRRKPGAKFCKAVGYERVMMFVDTRIGVSGVRE